MAIIYLLVYKLNVNDFPQIGIDKLEAENKREHIEFQRKLSKEKFRDAIIEMVEDLEAIEDFDKEKDKISAKIAEMKSKLLDKIEPIKTLNLDEDRRAI